MSNRVVYARLAATQIDGLSRYIEAEASIEISKRYIAGLVERCDGLVDFPRRGTRRDDIFSGCRILTYNYRTVIAFRVDGERITIIAVFHGGQDYETVLRQIDDP